MRILYVLERYPELSQTFVAQELLGLQDAGAEIEVAALSRGAGGERPAPALIAAEFGALERIRATASVAVKSPRALTRQLTTERSWPPPGGNRRLRGALRMSPLAAAARRSDHLHAHFATEAADLARLLSAASGTPWSFTAHGVDAYGDPSALRRNLESAAFARACSDHVAERLAAAAPAAAGRIHEIGVAVDLDRFATDHPYAASGPLVAVGRLVEKKGFDDLIAAFALARSAGALGDRELVIVGEGPLRGELTAQAESAAAPVRFAGPLPNSDVAALLARASAFALTPRTAADGDRDGRPAALIEAMASALPVVSTTQPGIPGLIGRESGTLVTPGNRESLAEALTSLYSSTPEVRQAMGLSGRTHVRSLHARSTVAGRLMTLFEAS